ncbi:ferrochelatase [Campylobacter sp. MIT 97-5078]|uniref:ferrochelatase n=1 Tax=Campylobacter sp. MIT 97-5078 TaxID=1548153 RepID=UPI000512F7D4|nr:ferrochelatase [Campylobacter sp. MIT 97-5078]KGI55695.1 ferrochelatase [Campylobacter sp. MIT 97-5078]TQR27934.1 ferrochelatase [Campylobacter sp. MIT 97-5078]
MKLVLFLNMGGAENLKDCELFLKNMFNDPYILTIKNKFLRAFVAFCITKARVKAMQENYKHLGGKSPLNELTQSLCDKLNKEFKGKICFDFANLYVPPFAKEILSKYKLGKDDELVLFPLYPHHSQTTVTSSLEVLKKAIKDLKIQSKVSEIDVFYKDKSYNELIKKHILKANEDFKKGHKKHLIFSAHSLPVSIIKKGDVYEKHINEHFNTLKKELEPYFEKIELAYQSKLGPVKWLEPNTSDIIANLDNEALIYPLAFCIDCSETVFELEIEYRKIASKDYKVVACPNDSAEFVEFIKQYF